VPAALKLPENNREFWEKKLKRNVQRDKFATIALRSAQWHVLRLWEHELVDIDRKVKIDLTSCGVESGPPANSPDGGRQQIDQTCCDRKSAGSIWWGSLLADACRDAREDHFGKPTHSAQERVAGGRPRMQQSASRSSDANKATIVAFKASVMTLNGLSMPGIGVSNEPR